MRKDNGAPAALKNYDYPFQKDLIAEYPASPRDISRLLVLHRESGELEHRLFRNISSYFRRGDTLILNNTRVLPARLLGNKETGGKVEFLLLERLGQNRQRSCQQNRWQVMAKPAARIHKGMKVSFSGLEAMVEGRSREDLPLFDVAFEENSDFYEKLQDVGQIPLPPYIKRPLVPEDNTTYQTIFCRHSGAIAAPTAGLHFTEEVLEDLLRRGVRVGYVTLHVSFATFSGVREEHFKTGKLFREYYQFPAETAELIADTKKKKGRVFACGTTAVRVLETVAIQTEDHSGWTDLFIRPPYKFKIVDCLITNFHYPRTSLMLMVSAFAGRENILKAYQEAIDRKYRFLSYGDAMLIL